MNDNKNHEDQEDNINLGEEDYVKPLENINQPQREKMNITDPGRLESMIRSIDPTTEVEIESIIKVRANVISPANIAPTSKKWFLLPTLRPIAALASAALLFSAGLLASPSLRETESIAPSSRNLISDQKMTDEQSSDGSSQSNLSPDVAGSMVNGKLMAPWYGNRTYLVDKLNLDYDPKIAIGSEIIGDDSLIEDLAKKIALTFNVQGEVVKPEWGGLQIGNGTDETLYISSYGDQIPTWSYNNPNLDPWRSCWLPQRDSSTTVISKSESDKANVGSSTKDNQGVVDQDLGLEEPCSPKVEGKIDKSTAIEKAREILGTLTTMELAYTVNSDEYAIYISATPVLSGEITSAAYWSISFIGSEIWNASGAFAREGEKRKYQVISAKEAINRANDVRFSTYPTYPDDYNFDQKARVIPATEKANPKEVSESNRLSWPVELVEIVSAKISSIAVNDGQKVILAPAWELSTEDKRKWLVIAVSESELDMKNTNSALSGYPNIAVDSATVKK